MLLISALLLVAAAPVMVEPASSALNDYNPSFDAAERTMVFARSEADFRNARIYTASDGGGGWTAPEPIAFTDLRYSDSDPWLTADGNTLYFVSDRPAPGRGAEREDLDIWRSVRTADGWSAPEHLGPAVNSPGPELGPELHGDTLYFSSVRKGGQGGLDIYAARAKGQAFAPAAPLEGPFNGTGSDSDFTLSADGGAALFWRSRGKGAAIMLARRTAAGWSEPQPLDDSVNHGPFNFTPAFRRDGRTIRYASTRQRDGQEPGLADIYEAQLPAEVAAAEAASPRAVSAR